MIREEIHDILWDFARSVAKTTLNPHLNYSQTVDFNKKVTTKAIDDIIQLQKHHEPRNETQMDRIKA